METRFCETCGRETGFSVREEDVTRTVRGIRFSYRQKSAFCAICGSPVYDPDLHDAAVRADNEAYRSAAGLISVDEINAIMQKYDIAADPLATVLEIGTASIQRYLSGRLPSRQNSDTLRSVLDSPAKMEEYLEKNREKISDVAYRKCHEALSKLREFSEPQDKIELAAQYLINQLEDITPKALQKLLYYAQSFYAVLHDGLFLFPDDCQAWAHGPVYPGIYTKYREYRYNPIDDNPIPFTHPEERLSLREVETLDQIARTFGRYSGKTLENMTHLETPWIQARGTLQPGDRGNSVISKESLLSYFHKVADEYEIREAGDIGKYCQAMYARV